MKVLFLESHPLWIHGLPNGFADLGHTSIISGPLTMENISEMIETFHPDLVVSMGWSPEHSVEKQQWIRQTMEKEEIPLVYWATEDPLHTENFTLPLVKRMKPDFVFTVAPYNTKIYEKKGFKSAHLDFGYHKSIHQPVKPLVEYQCDIAVVANAYPEFLVREPDSFRLNSLQTLIKPLLKENFRIDFWGKGWNNMTFFLNRKIPRSWQHGYLKYTDANKVYSSAKIIIGLQNREDQLTQRTYEVLGSGGLLLSSDTPAVREKFTPDKHLIVSSNPEETVEKVSYYLNHADQRELIQKSGLNAVKNESYQQRAAQMIDILSSSGLIGKVHPSSKGKVMHYTDFIKERYVVHTAKPRETLMRIAKHYQISVEDIIALNRLEDDFIDIGQVLKIKEK